MYKYPRWATDAQKWTMLLLQILAIITALGTSIFAINKIINTYAKVDVTSAKLENVSQKQDQQGIKIDKLTADVDEIKRYMGIPENGRTVVLK